MDLEVALDPSRRREPSGVEFLDGGEVGLVGGQLGQDRVARSVAEVIVLRVDPEVGPDDRVVTDDPPETRFNQVVKRVVRRAGVWRRCGSAQDDVGGAVGHWFSIRRLGDPLSSPGPGLARSDRGGRRSPDSLGQSRRYGGQGGLAHGDPYGLVCGR